MRNSAAYRPGIFAVGKNLRKIREKRGISQAAIARTVGREPGFISDLENGARIMSPRMAVMLACSLNQSDPREFVAQALNIILQREGVDCRVTRGGLRYGERAKAEEKAKE